MRVRIDDATDGAMFVGELGLKAAPSAAVPRDHDPVFDADAAPVEFLVIVRHPLIHINQLRGHIAVRAIRVIGRQRILRLP